MRRLKLLAFIVVVCVGFISFNHSYPEPKLGLEIGNQIPDFRTTLINGEEFDLSSLRGNMVLIDFWASYDGNSRVENRQKMDLQSKFANSNFYRGEGFVIVSISLDRFKSPLRKAINEDGYVKALHICDYNGADSEIAKAFNVQKPSSFLIDGEGRLVASKASIDEVSSTLAYLSNY